MRCMYAVHKGRNNMMGCSGSFGRSWQVFFPQCVPHEYFLPVEETMRRGLGDDTITVLSTYHEGPFSEDETYHKWVIGMSLDPIAEGILRDGMGANDIACIAVYRTLMARVPVYFTNAAGGNPAHLPTYLPVP